MSLGIYFQGEDNRVCLWFSYSVWKIKIKLDSTVCFLSSAVNSNAIYLEGEELIRIENWVQCWHVKLEMYQRFIVLYESRVQKKDGNQL